MINIMCNVLITDGVLLLLNVIHLRIYFSHVRDSNVTNTVCILALCSELF